jgi:hypothetical protein
MNDVFSLRLILILGLIVILATLLCVPANTDAQDPKSSGTASTPFAQGVSAQLSSTIFLPAALLVLWSVTIWLAGTFFPTRVVKELM